MKQVEQAYKELDAVLRKASVSQIGGFRPPEDRVTSWFGGRGVGRVGETLPQYNGRDMFCLLQVKIAELPFIPTELGETKFLVVFFNRDEIPFNKPHGNGWLIREYASLDGLQLIPLSNEVEIVKDFPIKWSLVEDDAPDWENAWELVNLKPINETEGAEEKFFKEYKRYPNTKFGGFPCCIQHGANLEGYVFQISSEEKPRWMWADNGIAYFNRGKDGEWVFDCQFF
jgi:hypothetical protein